MHNYCKCLYLYSTRTLIIGIATRSTKSQIVVEAHVTGSLSSDLMLSNYVGQLSRARLAKQTLDDQVIVSYEISSAKIDHDCTN